MTKIGGRVFAGFFAGLFIVTSSALTIGVIWQAVQDHKTKSNTVDTSQLNDAEKKALAQAQAQSKLNNPTKEDTLDNFTPTTTPQTKLEVADTKVGTGDTVKPGDTITADYTGALMSNGQVFDASSKHGGPISFSLSGVIAGWSQGIPGMKVGGSRRLLIPANLAYGAQGNNGIPPNADLVFDVTVTKIGK